MKIIKKIIKRILAIFNLTIVRIQPIQPPKQDTETKSPPPTLHNSILRLVHLGLHNNGNAGDTLLFPAIRALLQKHLAPIEFTLIHVRNAVTQELIDLINAHDGVIIGGGGVLLKDTNYNQISGWQWPCPLDMMEKIKVPIIVFAIGYNRFREQEEFDQIFNQNINFLVDKAAFFSVRNNGSVEAIRSYVKPSLYDKVIFQPCPTTLLSRFYPYEKPFSSPTDEKILALNIPFDRSNLRYCYQESGIFKLLAEAIREIEIKNEKWKVVLYNHLDIDKEAAVWLGKYGIHLPQLNLQGMPPAKVIQWYNHASAVIGGRGHAQMIPFGLNLPIFSLISHNKIRWFLNDINHPKWGEEILSPLLKDAIINWFDSIQGDGIKEEITKAQDSLWGNTLGNLQKIKDSFDSSYFPLNGNSETLFIRP
jgi:polysaccharide pyruvyl transferase WcaK-like protein